MQSRQVTYQTRINADKSKALILSSYAKLFNEIERKLFVDIIKNKDLNTLKKEYLKKYEITARQFNALRFEVEGKIKSSEEIRKEKIRDFKNKVSFLQKAIRKYKNKNKIHQKKRKLFSLENKLKKLENEKYPKICFGSKKLFHAQFYLEENGFKDLKEWKKKWQEARSNSFFIVGSKDETSGCQSCQLFKKDGKLALKIRLPNSLKRYGKYLSIDDVEFSYGQNEILKAYESNEKRIKLIKEKNPLYKYYGKAINYRFLKDQKGFRVFITISLENDLYISKKENGLIGIDINVDHLALTETDRFLNPVKSIKVKLCTYGKSKNQSLAKIGDAVAKIVAYANEKNKPIVIEKLDFQKKKLTLKETSKKHARMLSSFSYKSIIETIKARAFKFKIEVFEVNPAFSSVIGRVKFQKRYGLSSHGAAALVLARRYMNFSEKPPSKSYIFDKKGSMRAFFLPERNRKKHLWSFWGQVFGILKAVDAPHFWTTKSRSSSISTCEIKSSENYERNSHTLMSVDKTAWSTSLKKSLLHV